jgi:hypothetical protein
MKIKEVSVENYLTKKLRATCLYQIDVLDYNKKNRWKSIDCKDFYKTQRNILVILSDLQKYHIVITGHFMVMAPDILPEMLNYCKIKVVGDVSCDINGPIRCTLRSSTIAEQFYGYLPSEHKEADVFHS